MGCQIFISYSHKDNTENVTGDADGAWLEKLRNRLRPLEIEGAASIFSDRDLLAGDKWRDKLQGRLHSADIAILFVSWNFLGSKFIREHELPVLLDRAKEDRLTLLWILVEECQWESLPIEEFQSVNKRSLTALSEDSQEEQEKAWKQIYQVVEGACQARSKPVSNPSPGPPIPPCPYPGLRPFEEREYRYFHGRRTKTGEMLEAVKTCRSLMVIGPSGSGKSSLVFAGLLPELKQQTSRPWEVLTLRPQQNPADNLNLSLPGILEQPEETVARYLASASRSDASRLLLVVDQFEECFTQAVKEERKQFFDVLQRLRKVERCTVLLTLRAVFLEDLMQSELWPAEEGDRIKSIEVTPLRGDELMEAIVKPAAAAGVVIDPGLVQLLLADAAGEPGRLPLLQTTLQFLWGEKKEGRLHLDAYKKLGDEGRQRVAYALARKADEALYPLSRDERKIARRIFLRLTQFVEGRPETRRQQPLSALHDAAEDSILVEQTVNKLAGNGLLVVDWQGDNKLVDLAHEALITAWPTLRDWIAQGREPEQERRDWESEAAEWLKGNKKKDFLLAEEPLQRLQEWLRSPGAAFVGYSRTLAEFAEASHKALVRIWNRSLAEDLAKQAEAQLERDPDLALRLAMEAVSITWSQGQPFAQAEDALRLALVHTPVRRIGHAHQGEVLGMAVSHDGRLLATTGAEGTAMVWDVSSGHLKISMNGHAGPVHGTAFDPGGACLATAGEDSTVRIWNLSSGRQLSELTGHEGAVTGVAYSPAGNALVTAGEDATARIWDLPTNELRLTLRGHRLPIRTVAFNANGTLVATAGDDAIVRIWTVDGEEIHALLGHVNRVWHVAWGSFDSVATAGEDRTVRIWDVTTGLLRLTRQRHEGPVRSVHFDAAGGLLTASEDGTVRIWGTRGGEVEEVRILRSPGARLVGATYGQSSTGRFVLATGADGATRLWRATDGQEIEAHRFDDACRLADALFGPAGLHTLLLVPGNVAAFAPDGGYAQVQDVKSGDVVTTLQESRAGSGSRMTGAVQAVPSHASGISYAAYSPDGRFLATASQDQTARIWNANSGQELALLGGHEGPVRRISWSPDGQWVVTASEDYTVRVWKVATEPFRVLPFRVLAGHTGKIYAAAFSPPDGNRIATASADGTTRIWDRETGDPPHLLGEHQDSVNDVAWSPDGRWVATVSEDSTARIWSWEEKKSKHILLGHENGVLVVAWSPDGHTLATAGQDGTIRLWDTASGERRSTLRGHTAGVRGVTFSPDGKYVVSTGHDRTIRQYRVDVQDLLEEAEGRKPRQLTPAERARYLKEMAEPASAA